MTKTQKQMQSSAEKKIADGNKAFMEMWTHPTHPLTCAELRKLIKKRPAVWGRFSAYLKKGRCKK